MIDYIAEQDETDRMADNLRMLRKILDEIEGWENALTPPAPQAAGSEPERSGDAAGSVA